MAVSRGILSTDPQYKVWEEALKAKKKANKPISKPVEKKGCAYRDLTDSEKRRIDKLLSNYNSEQRRIYGIDDNHIEIR